MARCEDCLHYKVCLDIESQHLRIILAGDKAERCKRFMPTADVVPKSEYEAVVSAVDNSTNEFLKLHDAYQNAKTEVETLKDTNEHLAVMLMEAKQEVAREIFEEIEKAIEKCKYNQETPFGTEERYNPYAIIKQVAKLKKKYTEEQNNVSKEV